ncbi:MAG: hypothetical protein AAF449_14835, partial [Myxococcota bacterium]
SRRIRLKRPVPSPKARQALAPPPKAEPAPPPKKVVDRTSVSPPSAAGGPTKEPIQKPSGAIGLVRDPTKLDLNVQLQAKPEDVLLPPPPPPDPSPIVRLKLKRTAGGGFLYKTPTFSAQIEPDGHVVIQDRLVQGVISPGEVVQGHGVQPLIIKPPMAGVKFDVTDVVMTAVGDDPYLHRKLTFLEETSELRAELAARACEERLSKALYTLRSDLEQIWDDSTVPAARRRLQLFQLWDDCAEATDDETVVGYAEQARATIIAFIQERLPETSAFAYSSAELIALNRRRHSSVAFDPYASFGE